MNPACTTPSFPGWSRQLGPMKARLADTGRQLRSATLAQLEVRLGNCLPGCLLAKPTAGPNSRERVYSLPRTFWSWLWQMLNHNAPCREVVRQVQALHSLQGGPVVDEDTGGYCQARARLPLSILEKALVASAHTAARRAPALALLRVVRSRWWTVPASGWPTPPPIKGAFRNPPIKNAAAVFRF